MTRYRTIVADPPWHYDRVPTSLPSGGVSMPQPLRNEPLRYSSLSIEAIRETPVDALAAPDARLFLWVTNRWLPEGFTVLSAWGFKYRQTLVWHKKDGGPFTASVAPNTAEYLLVATRGHPERLGRFPSAVMKVPIVLNHSQKPETFLDWIEQVSPGPYAELFARRARFGWDYPSVIKRSEGWRLDSLP